MKNKSENSLPKILPGTVHEQFVRCGKSNCKCVKGELHGPYYYHFVRVKGRLKKKYLKGSEVDVIRAACFAGQEEKKRHCKQKDDRSKLRELREKLSEITKLYR